MKFITHKNFEKQFSKLPAKRKEKVIEAIDQFIENPNTPKLRRHELSGNWAGHFSLSAGGDLRIHYRIISSETGEFVAVGSHSQLYK
jgi:addiction module RelE/StbE family toxin